MKNYDFDLYMINKDTKDNYFMKINKDKYNNDREYIEKVNTINMIKLLTDNADPDFENITEFEVDCKLKLRDYDDYKDIKLSYYQNMNELTNNFAGITYVSTKLKFISKEKDNSYLIDEILYEYKMMNGNVDLNNKRNTVKVKRNETVTLKDVSERCPKFYLSLEKFTKEFMKMITELNKYEDIQFLIDGTYYSLKDINLHNKDLFRTATNKEFKNYLVKKGFR
ncbi:hypothetical protein CPT_MarsHill_121 [Staphylococcus phage MarsHill]|nr:hypothetical protein CPT_MarsHill_121 [Staphylococcus phage MarsHill]